MIHFHQPFQSTLGEESPLQQNNIDDIVSFLQLALAANPLELLLAFYPRSINNRNFSM